MLAKDTAVGDVCFELFQGGLGGGGIGALIRMREGLNAYLYITGLEFSSSRQLDDKKTVS